MSAPLIAREDEQAKAAKAVEALKGALREACEPLRKSLPVKGYHPVVTEHVRDAMAPWWQNTQTTIKVELNWFDGRFEVSARVKWPAQNYLIGSPVRSFNFDQEAIPDGKPDVGQWQGWHCACAFRITGLRYPKQWSQQFERRDPAPVCALPESEPQDIQWTGGMSNEQFAHRLRDKRRLAQWTR